MDLMSQEEKVARARMKQDAFNAFDAEVRFSMMRPIPLEVAIKRMEMKQDAFDAWAAVESSMNPDPKKNKLCALEPEQADLGVASRGQEEQEQKQP